MRTKYRTRNIYLRTVGTFQPISAQYWISHRIHAFDLHRKSNDRFLYEIQYWAKIGWIELSYKSESFQSFFWLIFQKPSDFLSDKRMISKWIAIRYKELVLVVICISDKMSNTFERSVINCRQKTSRQSYL